MTLPLALLTGLLLHLVGDYVTQTQWMADEKTHRDAPAWAHATVYSIPFYFLLVVVTGSWVEPVWGGGVFDSDGFWGHPAAWGLMVILVSHAYIDRYRLAKYLCWAKNQAAPSRYRYPWREAGPSGYHKDMPHWLAFWLLILADNTLHIAINSVAILWVYG